MCKHSEAEGRNHAHTCSGFYHNSVVIYCVPCIWEQYSKKTAMIVHISELPRSGELTWNGELHVSEMREYHENRVKDCDMSYPIFVTLANDFGRREIIDGCHRLLRAHRDEQTFITVIELSAEELRTCKFF